MNFSKEETLETSSYWCLHDRQEMRMMTFDHQEDVLELKKRIQLKCNRDSRNILPLSYMKSDQKAYVSVEDQEDYSICTIAMKKFPGSTDPAKGFDLYLQWNDCQMKCSS